MLMSQYIQKGPMCDLHRALSRDGYAGRWVKLISSSSSRTTLDIAYIPLVQQGSSPCQMFDTNDAKKRILSCLKQRRILVVGDSHVRDILSTIVGWLGWSSFIALQKENGKRKYVDKEDRHYHHVITRDGVEIVQIFLTYDLDINAIRVLESGWFKFDHVFFSFGAWHVMRENVLNVGLSQLYERILERVLGYSARRRRRRNQPPFTFLPLRPFHAPHRMKYRPQNCTTPHRVDIIRRLQQCVFARVMRKHKIAYEVLDVASMINTPYARATSTFDGHHYNIRSAVSRELARVFLHRLCETQLPTSTNMDVISSSDDLIASYCRDDPCVGERVAQQHSKQQNCLCLSAPPEQAFSMVFDWAAYTSRGQNCTVTLSSCTTTSQNADSLKFRPVDDNYFSENVS
eukprot:PhM_4_TR435/c0_g1_i1/m.20110